MENEEEISEEQPVAVHVDNADCQCQECREKRKYVTIVDIDRFVASLPDWD